MRLCIFIILIVNGCKIDLYSVRIDTFRNRNITHTSFATNRFSRSTDHNTLSIRNANLSSGKTRHHHSPSDTLRYIVKRSEQSVTKGEILPDIVTAGRVARVEAGQSARLTCTVNNLGKYVVMWKQNGRVISAGNLLVRKDNRFQLKIADNNFNLEISDLTLDDASDYKCEVDIMGRPISIVHTLEVLIAPQIQAKESKVRLKKGENYTLRCSAHGHPNPRITWTKKVGSISPISGLSLDLVDVDRHANGEYICTASNGVGVPASASISVEIQYPPEIHMDQQWRLVDKKITVKIDCIVHGNPSTQVTWFKNSGKIFETDKVLMTVKSSTWSLKLSDLSSNDFGNFSCQASNSLGTARGYSGVTGKPSQLVFTSPSLNHNLAHYNLTWRTESFSPIIAYKLRFKLAKVENNTNSLSSGEWSEVAVPVPYLESFSSSWFYTFPFLESGTVYDIIGLAKNKYGWGPPSSTFTFFNKGIDYSTQQIKYKDPGKPEIEVPPIEDQAFEEEPLLQDRSFSDKTVSKAAPIIVTIAAVLLRTVLYR
eukprot:TRINITY_DN7935_c0_g1_i1.p1 TRINITY_DN7935_c0_g1~~TRINITY_DN7935_c0_g1_i1.p1  ORF type:complete len:540 (-),score=51.18 TRINITY_DN7935_c0_g1_i1:141-1760(-)